MDKGIVRLGYQNFVLDLDDALTLTKLLNRAERYDTKWHRGEEGASSVTTHHIWEELSEIQEIKIMSENTYRMAKLAGQPQKD